ncbi:5-methylcytosine-specific restriction endonuclease system specificity protein McrC [candidate division KSB1 bacterium]
MDIPVYNIYYMLCYAWGKLDEADVVEVDPIDSPELFDLFGKVLFSGMSYLFRRGLDRCYLSFNEETRTIRGRIDFNTTLKKGLLGQPRVYCTFDELNHNTLHNRILKSSIKNLIYYKNLDSKIRDDLIFVYRKLHGIEDLVLEKRHFGLVRLNRNNYFYDFLLKICELIFDNMFVSEVEGKSKFRSFIKDKDKMSYLFEEFIRKFYKIHLKNAMVKRDQIRWNMKSFDEKSEKYIPIMETDTSITFKDPKRKIVIETKYSKSIFQEQYNKKSIKSPNLYQLYAYLKNLEGRGDHANKHCEGILLYAEVDQKVDLKYFIDDHHVSVKTINLNQDWKNIHRDLLNIISPEMNDIFN